MTDETLGNIGTRRQGLVYDDSAGTIRAALDTAMGEARRLHDVGVSIETEADFVGWREEVLGWRLRSVELLRRVFEREAANEFARGARLWGFERGKWRRRLQEDARDLEDAIELLVALRNSLGGKGEPDGRKRGWGSRSGEAEDREG
jgi:hypothetical protein